MWYLWEAINGKFCVMCEMQEMDPWKVCEGKEGEPEVGDFVCGRCKKQADGFMDSVEELCKEVETVRGFCYLGGRVNAGGACEAAVTARARIGRVKLRECGELLHAKRSSLKLKGMVYRSCVRSAMLYGGETWGLRENEMAILRRTERAMVRAMCGAKLIEKKRTEDLMEMLGLKETAVQMAKANGGRWYRHVLRRDDRHVLRKVGEFEVRGKRKRGRPKKTCKWRRRARAWVWRKRTP